MDNHKSRKSIKSVFLINSRLNPSYCISKSLTTPTSRATLSITHNVRRPLVTKIYKKQPHVFLTVPSNEFRNKLTNIRVCDSLLWTKKKKKGDLVVCWSVEFIAISCSTRTIKYFVREDWLYLFLSPATPASPASVDIFFNKLNLLVLPFLLLKAG